MKNGHELDLSTWPRRSHYAFYREYEQPFFNVCAELRVTRTRAWARAEEGRSFSLACWYLCQEVVNELEPFRYRLRPEGVWVHDRVRVATAILNPDETFRFGYFPWGETFQAFATQARAVIQRAPSDDLDARPQDDDVIHGSTLPWLRFTSVAHARRPWPLDSVPKITFGRAVDCGAEVMMPVSVEVHHALMDGLHASRFYPLLEDAMARPEELLR